MISIIVPVLNEESTLNQLLEHLHQTAGDPQQLEVILVDGGSEDSTVEIAKNWERRKTQIPVYVYEGQRGRARQMNLGAQKANGTVLYFLHADSLTPDRFDRQIRAQIDAGVTAGCFRMKFDQADFLLRFCQWFTKFNVLACRGGDQSLFVKREAFESLGGYDEKYTIYEDTEFIARLYEHHDFAVIKDYITTSSRRYAANGTWRLQYHFTVIHLKKWLGASPDHLHRYYQRHIVS